VLKGRGEEENLSGMLRRGRVEGKGREGVEGEGWRELKEVGENPSPSILQLLLGHCNLLYHALNIQGLCKLQERG
jgi:hypothetical protein